MGNNESRIKEADTGEEESRHNEIEDADWRQVRGEHHARGEKIGR